MPTPPLVTRIQDSAARYAPEIVHIRRDLHKNPELGYQEFRTARTITSVLEKLKIQFSSGIARTGIVATIHGKGPGPTLALRADIDALPIQEANEFDFASVNAGVMHACGHDAHTAMLLGAAMILNDLRDQFAGSVRLVFQPSEEVLPGGAKPMIDEGILNHVHDTHEPSAIFGQHVAPDLPAGTIGVRSGPFMASTDEIYITVNAEGGHAAEPHLLDADAVLVAAHIVIALQSLISRNCPPGVPSVLSFGKLVADGATNVIPDTVTMEGTLRSFGEKWRTEAHRRLERVARNTAQAFGATCSVEIRVGYPMLINSPDETAFVRESAVEYVGEANVTDVDRWFASEDFAYYLQQVPGSFFRLGTGNKERGITHALHTPRFTVDESALGTGAGFFAYLTVQWLQRYKADSLD